MLVCFQRICNFGLFAVILSISIGLFAITEGKNTTTRLCRVAGNTPSGIYLSPKEFALFSCAKCYRHMDARLFSNGTKLVHRGLSLLDPKTGKLYEPSYKDASNPVFLTFSTTKETYLWIQCCQAAERCCETMTSTPPSTDPNICPRTWDGWNCWSDTDRDTVQQAACPSYIYFHTDAPQCTRYARKTCWDNSTWYRNHKGNEFTDYSTCGQGEDIKLLLKAHVITFGISIVLLIPALGIFFFYRQLQVHRIFMHKNLFLSLLLTAVFVIIFESYFIVNSINSTESILEANQVGCKLFYTITKYLRLTTYMWMFCEGFYLHKLIAAAFTEQKGIMVFLAIGWGLPVIPVTVWAIIRQFAANEMCWTVPGDYEWVLHVPMLTALVANFCFLAHIIQIIITKLRSTNTDEPAQFRRALKATMVLIPLFGLHFLFLSYHPANGDCHIKLIYNITTYSVDGLQGGIVSMLFCYLNNEVIYLLKRTYNRKKMERDISNHMSSRRTRESRTSVSTNVESVANEIALSRGLKKK